MPEIKYNKEKLKNAWKQFVATLVGADIHWNEQDDEALSDAMKVVHMVLKKNGVYVE